LSTVLSKKGNKVKSGRAIVVLPSYCAYWHRNAFSELLFSFARGVACRFVAIYLVG